MVITLNNVSFRYTDKFLLKDAKVSFDDKKHVGVVGSNGAGKSTLLKIIVGLETIDSGEITKSGNMVISYLEQDPTFSDNARIKDVMANLGSREHPINEYEVSAILNKLKLYNHEAYANKLSGGERKRLALAMCLVKYCDILILDEPTNHLDNDMILWLEKYLIKWSKGLIMVTHDRYFLERVCNRMIEIDDASIYSYDANYEYFLELKALRLEALEKEKQKWKSLYKNELAWMRRGVEARRTKQKGRIMRFEELAKKEFGTEKSLDITSMNKRLGKKLIEIYDASLEIGGKVLFKDFNFMLNRSDIVGVVGNNGAGKSSLFKAIIGELELTHGRIERGETLRIGYFKQIMDEIDPNITVLDYINSIQTTVETIDGIVTSKDMLERFMFDGSLQHTLVKRLSGGEKRRLQLLSVLIKNPNLLILDEPTNDLDLYTLEILEDYLETFNGPVLIVSHDRYFLDKTINRLLAFEDTYINEYLLDFSGYLEKTKDNRESKENTYNKKPKTGMSAKLKNELNELPGIIDSLEKSIKKCDDEMKENFSNYHKLLEIEEMKERFEKELEESTSRYFTLLEMKENE